MDDFFCTGVASDGRHAGFELIFAEEPIDKDTHFVLSRRRVSGGWLYRTVDQEWDKDGKQIVATALAFVPDQRPAGSEEASDEAR